MVRGGFDAMVNPFGTLYNPASIAVNLLRALSEKEVLMSGNVVFENVEGVWHSWLHHSSFSSVDAATVVARINETTHRVADFLRDADVLIVTLGTAIIYRLKETGMLVANCHKQPDSLFVRERLTAYDIVDQWQMLLQLLESVNPKLKILMMDELRDYRFYADDMIHPSVQAVEYIWQRFQDTYFDNKTKDAVAKATKEWARRQHRTIVKN
jgi:hypothetical protein